MRMWYQHCFLNPVIILERAYGFSTNSPTCIQCYCLQPSPNSLQNRWASVISNRSAFYVKYSSHENNPILSIFHKLNCQLRQTCNNNFLETLNTQAFIFQWFTHLPPFLCYHSTFMYIPHPDEVVDLHLQLMKYNFWLLVDDHSVRHHALYHQFHMLYSSYHRE